MEPSFVTPAVPARARSLRALLGDALKRPGGRRGVTVLSAVLLVAGVTMFAYPVGTDVYSHLQQGQLDTQFADPALQGQYKTHDVPVGNVLTRLRIPKQGIALDVLVVEGTTPAALRAGAGHYGTTPLPGENGNVAIAGHRTTFGRPFNHLDEMAPGDEVILDTPLAVYHYRAVAPFGGHPNPWIVAPTDYSVVGQAGMDHMLTLTTCNPKGSAAQRLILRLHLVSTQKVTARKVAA